ncbi:hypothetical protein VPHD63_0055 [Vibrio phage D63]
MGFFVSAILAYQYIPISTYPSAHTHQYIPISTYPSAHTHQYIHITIYVDHLYILLTMR